MRARTSDGFNRKSIVRSRGWAAAIRTDALPSRDRTIDFRLKPSEVLARVDRSLAELEQLVHKAGAAGCDALALPEGTLGLLKWESAHPRDLGAVLPEAVSRMLDRLGKAASEHRMYLVVCNDAIETDGHAYNTAFLFTQYGRAMAMVVALLVLVLLLTVVAIRFMRRAALRTAS